MITPRDLEEVNRKRRELGKRTLSERASRPHPYNLESE